MCGLYIVDGVTVENVTRPGDFMVREDDLRARLVMLSTVPPCLQLEEQINGILARSCRYPLECAVDISGEQLIDHRPPIPCILDNGGVRLGEVRGDRPRRFENLGDRGKALIPAPVGMTFLTMPHECRIFTDGLTSTTPILAGF